MRKERFWFGTAMILIPLLVLLILLAPAVEEESKGSVDGHVSIHGRPVTGGTITFIPDNPVESQWVRGSIDENGNFSIWPGWHRGTKRKLSYQIQVTPDDPNQPSMVSKVVSPDMTPLRVWLDNGPAHVDIAL